MACTNLIAKFIPAALAACLLVACGGGGGGDGSATAGPSGTAEGFWEGSTSTGYDAALAVLENGETWGFYMRNGVLYGALYGQTQSSGSSASGSGSDFNLATRTVSSSTYSGTVAQRSTLSLRTSGGVSFTGQFSPSYDQAASLAATAGTFNGFGVTGSTAAQAISAALAANGAITVPASGGCAASGSAAPRSSGKNVFDVSVTFSGITCALGNGATATGIAYYDTASRQLLVMAMNAGKTDGFIYVGRK